MTLFRYKAMKSTRNKYAKHARISERKEQEITRYFATDLTALQTAELTGAYRNTITRVCAGPRQRVLIACEDARLRRR